MRRSTVLSLPLQLVFPGQGYLPMHSSGSENTLSPLSFLIPPLSLSLSTIPCEKSCPIILLYSFSLPLSCFVTLILSLSLSLSVILCVFLFHFSFFCFFHFPSFSVSLCLCSFPLPLYFLYFFSLPLCL